MAESRNISRDDTVGGWAADKRPGRMDGSSAQAGGLAGFGGLRQNPLSHWMVRQR
jgi:hypothetical protein